MERNPTTQSTSTQPINRGVFIAMTVLMLIFAIAVIISISVIVFNNQQQLYYAANFTSEVFNWDTSVDFSIAASCDFKTGNEI